MKTPLYSPMILVLSFLLLGKTVLFADETTPFFNLPRLGSEKQVTLDDFRGKIVVLDFFSADCGDCFRASFELQAGIEELYAARSGNPHGVAVQVVAISSEIAGPEDMNAFIRETGLGIVLVDSEGDLLKRYGGDTTPYLVVVDATGTGPDAPAPRVVYRKPGYEGLGKLHEAINAITGKTAPGSAGMTRELTTILPTVEADRRVTHETTLDLAAITSSDLFVSDTLTEYHQKRPSSEFTVALSYRHIEADYISAYLGNRRENQLEEDHIGVQGSAGFNLNEILILKFGGGAYDGFQTYRALWLDEYYRHRFDVLGRLVPDLNGYRNAHPWGYNVSSGLRWEYLPESGFADASVTYQHDIVSPGYEIGVPVVVRLRDTYDTVSGRLAFENVLTRRLRTMFECRIDDTTARDVRLTLQGALNYAPAENWVIRLAAACATEEPDFTSESVSAVLERDWHGTWFVSVFGRYYEDSSEIANGIARNAVAPPLETYQAGLGVRRQGNRSSFKLVIGPCFNRYELHPRRDTAFDQLYKNRDWLSVQAAFLHRF